MILKSNIYGMKYDTKSHEVIKIRIKRLEYLHFRVPKNEHTTNLK